jgi:hypothetical protein
MIGYQVTINVVGEQKRLIILILSFPITELLTTQIFLLST